MPDAEDLIVTGEHTLFDVLEFHARDNGYNMDEAFAIAKNVVGRLKVADGSRRYGHHDGEWTYSRCPCGDKVCKDYMFDHVSEGRFDEVDAKLIKAAPQMVKELDSCLLLIDLIYVDTDVEACMVKGRVNKLLDGLALKQGDG